MPIPNISLHDLFSIIDEHRIYEFCRQHAFTNKAFADAIVTHCRQTYRNRPAMLDELKRYGK